MKKLRRYDIPALLADPELRRRLVVRSTIATQAREGIDVSEADAEKSYYVVTQAERAAFFGLVSFRTETGDNDGRHSEFAHALSQLDSPTRIDLAHKDFLNIEGTPLAYDKLRYVAWVFRENPNLEAVALSVEQGVAMMNTDRYVRFCWEVEEESIARSQAERSKSRSWVPLSKGGNYSRFYYDYNLVIYAQTDWEDMKEEIKLRYPYLKGNSSLLIHPKNHYFELGITWPLRTQRGFNARFMPAGHIFSHKGPCVFFSKEINVMSALALLNSGFAEFLLKALVSFGSWEITGIRRLPFPAQFSQSGDELAELGRRIYIAKQSWDTGNEVATRFDRPWLLQTVVNKGVKTLTSAVASVLELENNLDSEATDIYQQINDAVYRLYGVNEVLRRKIEAAIGARPPEVVWPQMEGKTTEQKRTEHVCRLLTYAVKCVLEQDDDGLVALQPVAQEPPLLERVRAKLAGFFHQQDQHTLEIELINELKKRVKGYARAESLHDWLTDVFFDFHCTLYQKRPILWHLASSQESAEAAFSVIVHYHRFDHDRLAKLRSVHVRDRLATLRREAAQAGKDGREDDRIQLLTALEEVEAFDRKLARLQEGHHAGAEGGTDDYRILTPWKKPEERPKGWRPDLDDGVKVNIAPLARTGLLRTKNKFGAKEPED